MCDEPPSSPSPIQRFYEKFVKGPICGEVDQDAEESLHLTPEEQDLLADCAEEAMYFRAIPTAILLGGFSNLALRGSCVGISRIPIAGLVAVAGYYLGLASYQSICRLKLIEYRSENPPNEDRSDECDDPPPPGSSLDPFKSPGDTYSDEYMKRDIDDDE